MSGSFDLERFAKAQSPVFARALAELEAGRKESAGDKGNEPSPEKQKSDRSRHLAAKKAMPLYIGLATGFCGSFTSF